MTDDMREMTMAEHLQRMPGLARARPAVAGNGGGDLEEDWEGDLGVPGNALGDLIRDEWELSAEEFMGKYFGEEDDVEDGDEEGVELVEEEDEASLLDEGADGDDPWRFEEGQNEDEDEDKDEDEEGTLTGTGSEFTITGPVVIATESENESEPTAETATESEPRGKHLSRRLDSPNRTHDRETLPASQYIKKYGSPLHQIPVWRLRDPISKLPKKYTSPPPPPSPPIPSSKKARRNKDRGKGKGKGRRSGANDRKERSETSVSAPVSAAAASTATATARESIDARDEVGSGLFRDRVRPPHLKRLDKMIIEKLTKGLNESNALDESNDADAGLFASERVPEDLHPDLAQVDKLWSANLERDIMRALAKERKGILKGKGKGKGKQVEIESEDESAANVSGSKLWI